jgi:ornithine cyclodeaminase/alanine dehydrogenase
MKTLVLDGDDVRALLQPDHAIVAVERALAAHGRREAVMPAKVYLSLPAFDGDFRAMPVYLDGYAGLKWVNAHPLNPKRHGLPAVLAVFVLSDPSTGVPLAIMDATGVTAMRTGAVAAVATKHLSRNDVGTIGIVGCGAQARAVIACHRHVMAITEVRLFDRDADAARELASELADLPTRVVSLTEAAGADVVCTLTPSRAAVVPDSAIVPGAHVNAMGADAPGKQELDPRILGRARVFVDDWHQCLESGEINVPLAQGLLGREQIAGSLGEVLAGLRSGRSARDDVTVFDSTGLAVQDLAVARIVYERARESGLGTDIDLLRP